VTEEVVWHETRSTVGRNYTASGRKLEQQGRHQAIEEILIVKLRLG